jgi:hypothetical protein
MRALFVIKPETDFSRPMRALNKIRQNDALQIQSSKKLVLD